MDSWVTVIAAIFGGGVLAKIVDMVAFRDKDGAAIRAELWKELGALRERADRQDRIIAKMGRRYQQTRKLVNSLMLRLLALMSEVNDVDREMGRTPRYNVIEEERRMRAGDPVCEGTQALEEDEADPETPDSHLEEP